MDGGEGGYLGAVALETAFFGEVAELTQLVAAEVGLETADQQGLVGFGKTHCEDVRFEVADLADHLFAGDGEH